MCWWSKSKVGKEPIMTEQQEAKKQQSFDEFFNEMKKKREWGLRPCWQYGYVRVQYSEFGDGEFRVEGGKVYPAKHLPATPEGVAELRQILKDEHEEINKRAANRQFITSTIDRLKDDFGGKFDLTM